MEPGVSIKQRTIATKLYSVEEVSESKKLRKGYTP
jgi:hypothetical protein